MKGWPKLPYRPYTYIFKSPKVQMCLIYKDAAVQQNLDGKGKDHENVI